MLTSGVDSRSSPTNAGLRTILWLALGLAEGLTVSYVFDFNPGGKDYFNPVFYVTRSARWAALSLPIFLILTWSQRAIVVKCWTELSDGHEMKRALAVNLGLFTVLCAACLAFSSYAAMQPAPPWLLLAPLGVLALLTGLSLITVVAPLRQWGRFAKAFGKRLVVAGAMGLGILLLSQVAVSMWDNMAWATLETSAAILRLYESNVVVDTVERGIRVGDFGVAIWETCSGVEGLALVTGFVTIYLWAFRAELRFPRAFVLYPIGLIASWLLNSVRIALLTSIGAHYSPEIAAKGFHSQAGWIAFLLVTLGLMVLADRTGLLAKPIQAESRLRPANPRYDATFAHLLPFVGMMLGTVAMAATVPHHQPAYVLKVLLVGGALLVCWRSYNFAPLAVSTWSVATGALIGAVWIMTSPEPTGDEPLGVWLKEIGPAAAALWLVARGLGTIVLVPVAEEFAFRGYLYRRIVSRDFHLVAATTFSWSALIISSVLFGLLHERWFAGTIAGALFGLCMLRTGRLSDAIAAHATANALIFAWALAAQDWSLL